MFNQPQTDFPVPVPNMVVPRPPKNLKPFSLLLFCFTLIIILGLSLYWWGLHRKASLPQPVASKISRFRLPPEKLEKFKSNAEFNNYLNQESNPNYGVGLNTVNLRTSDVNSIGSPNNLTMPALPGTSYDTPDRYSQTNVQVVGIDEPDIAKTDGTNIYYSRQNIYQPLYDRIALPNTGEGILPPPNATSGIKIIGALPPEKAQVKSSIDNQNGDLLVWKNLLLVSSPQKISAFDITNSTNPIPSWSYTLLESTRVVTSRLFRDQLILVTSKSIYPSNANCPIYIMENSTSKTTINCSDIYHPTAKISANSLYTVSIISPQTGKITYSTSILGTVNNTIYVSPTSLYLTYVHPADMLSIFYSFVEESSDLFPADLTKRIAQLQTYDISSAAKMTELTVLLQQYQNSLDPIEKTKLDTEMEDRSKQFSLNHIRDFESTGIVKLNISDLSISSVGSVPGHLLNQFALDESREKLRVATTATSFLGQSDTVNDVYVLNSDLSQSGSLLNLGLNRERIYSVRFIGDLGYMVTFRQVDPFYVLDLSNPALPKVAGELKIPGYSSYLHPLSSRLILGIGKEGTQVKLSLFDVTDPTNPKEIDKAPLNNYSSEVLSNHRAFMQDAQNQIFFLPGDTSSYIFSYKNNRLVILQTLSQFTAKRAFFINNNLYLVGDSALQILDETTWSKINQISL